MPPYIGTAVRRREDHRLLTGAGRFVDDIPWPERLEMAVVRSAQAHARIRGIRVAPALALPGVVAAFSAADLPELDRPLPLPMPHPALRAALPRPLARDVVRYVGEPVAVVLATDRYAAEDGAEAVEVDYDPLPAVTDAEAALAPDAPLLHLELGTNLAAEIQDRFGDVEAAFANANLVVRRRLRMHRCSPQPLETRRAQARWDAGTGELLMYDSTQAPHTMRRFLAERLNMSEERIRLIAPDVGGGFGGKNRLYPEEVLVASLAIRLNRPVRWVGDRREDFLATYHAREQVHDAEIAVRRDGTILGVRTHFAHDTGAYSPFGVLVPFITGTIIPGPYRIPAYEYTMRMVYTNKTPAAPYRGAGQPQGVFVMERLIDAAAGELGLDPALVRARNLIGASDMPYNAQIRWLDGRPVTYDSGDPAGAFALAVERIGYEDVRREQRRREASGERPIGVSAVNYIEISAIGSYEGARIKIDPQGEVHVYTGMAPQGQSHHTTLAQICADRLGVPIEQVRVMTGDTALFTTSLGTWGSRSAVLAGSAVAGAARTVRQQALRLASVALEVRPEDLEVVEGLVRVRGTPQRGISLAELVQRSSGLRPVHLRAGDPPQGPGLEATCWVRPAAPTYANGAHAAVVEVDPSTGQVRLLRYVVVHDCGVMINPLVVEGQVTGGVAQGIGNALYEELCYDGQGQVLNASYMDYLLPTATEVPEVEIHHMESPSPLYEEGFKGAGEGAVVPVPAVINGAVDDALRAWGVYTAESPLTPSRLWTLLRAARGGHAVERR